MRQGRFITAGLAALAAAVMAPGVASAAEPFVDDTQAEFALGVPGADTAVTAAGSVELTRATKPQALADWLPATPWDSETPPLGSGTVTSGALTLNGARATAPRTFKPGQVMEFTGMFGAGDFQHIGFGNLTNETGDTSTFADGPWAMFSTSSSTSGSQLFVRTRTAAGVPEVSDPISLDLQTSHTYRIEWSASEVRYFVDGNLVNNGGTVVPAHPGISADMRPAASDLRSGGAALTVNTLGLLLYKGTGAYLSRVLDAGDARTVWGKLTPAVTGGGATFETRSGNTAVPDSSWSAYQPIAADGSIQSPSGRYIQYRATLSTTDDTTTPSLTRVELGYDIDTVAPDASLDVQLSGTTATATFSSTAADLARFECSQDGGAYATCTSPRAFTGLAPGSHTFSVRAVDKLGNVGAAVSKTVTVAAPGGTTPPPSGGGNAPDTKKPNVLVLGRSLKVSASGVAKLRIRCPRTETRCAVTVKLKKGGKRIARKSVTIPGGSTRTIRLKLSSAARAALAVNGKIKAKAVITATDAAGNKKTTTRRVTLKAPAV